MNPHTREAVHSEPVWRERSDFIIATRVDPGDTDIETEQLWVRKIGDSRFEICCIPFFAYDLALGDVVETDASYMFTRVVEPSGRYTFRVWFGNSSHPREEVADELEGLGALLEWSSRNLLAVDAIDADHAQVVADCLAEHERGGRLEYETGRS